VIANLVGGEWRRPEGAESLPVFNPATGEEIERVPLSGPAGLEHR
jgi:malonate-semialdehyde dehydrogenase (acetylating)/methylmalonate-semialdehyde dehydrogenase